MKPLAISILRLLSDGEFHSGEDMAVQLSVSRASISNALKEVDLNSISIYKVRGRGYCLDQPLRWLDAVAIKHFLGAQGDLFYLDVQDVTDSTNTALLQKVVTGAPHASCIVSELQTNGRGRRGRTWHAGLGGALTFSVLWRFSQGAAHLSGLSLAIGVAVVRALNEVGLSGVRLKWPNDVIHDFHKLAGILIEMQGDVLGPSAVVIGIGLNVNLNDHIRQNVDQPVTDVGVILGHAIDRNEMLAVMLRHLSDVLAIFERQGFVSLRDEWISLHAYHEKPVRLLMPDGIFRDGYVIGIEDDGGLLVETSLGKQKFTSGEISLRGLG